MISKKTMNAIEVCVVLAGQRHAAYLTTTELSPRLGLSISYLENILKPLKEHNIVTSMKGPGGGYRIRGDVSLVSIWEVASVFEQTLSHAEQKSTSTQSYELELEQVVKNTFLWHGRSYVRKALEAAITPAMELLWTKRRILHVYLNTAEFAEGVFGVQAAAQHHFGVDAADLSELQAARLAAQALHAVGVSVVSVRRAGGGVAPPSAELLLGAGDTLVLSGLPEPLSLAEAKLLKG